jgi:hypothetical protein
MRYAPNDWRAQGALERRPAYEKAYHFEWESTVA